MIITDHCREAACDAQYEAEGASLPGLAEWPAVLVAEGFNDDADEEGLEGEDVVAPLRVRHVASSLEERQERSHVVLLIDSSGSMRTCDVVADAGTGDGTRALLQRVDAAHSCAANFIANHTRRHPNDIFSIATFAEKASSVCQGRSAGAAVEALQDAAFHGARGTNYVPALRQASHCLERQPGRTGHVVLLSDGRPGDTKDALKVFQEIFVWGRHKGTRLHGIAFGSSAESFEALQQLACIGEGVFKLSGRSARGLSGAFTAVTSTITSIMENANEESSAPTRIARLVDFEPQGNGTFGKKGVFRCRATRASFRYDGQAFEKQEWPAADVQRRQRPYMRGGMRLVYGFSDAQVLDNSGGQMVAKLSRFSDPRFSSIPVVEMHAKSTAVARYYASLFETTVKQVSMKTPAMIFVPCFTYVVEDPMICGPDEPSVFAAERYLPGAFVKYNSNNGFVGEASLHHHDIVQAFLHFSFVRSGGTLAITDMQGVARESEVLLTDPQVVTVVGGHFGPGDLGARGLKSCLGAHRCGPACQKLGLKPISISMLRRLDSAISGPRRMDPRAATSSGLTTGSWERVESEADPLDADWDRVSVGGHIRSRPSSSSSWSLL